MRIVFNISILKLPLLPTAAALASYLLLAAMLIFRANATTPTGL